VLPLIFSHRDLVGLIKEDIRGHENRISEETNTDCFTLLLGLVFELNHSFQTSSRV
jgi:hypothetical protein